MIRILIGSLLFSLSGHANQTISGEISRIYPANNTVFFSLKNDPCNPNNKYYFFPLERETSKAWYSLILAAANTSKPIAVSIHEFPTDSHEPVRYIYQNF